MTKTQVAQYAFANGYEARYSGHSQQFFISPILPVITKETLLFHLNTNGIEGIIIQPSKFNFVNPKDNSND